LVEHIHDEMVAFIWPAAEPVSRDEYRDLSLIDSAVNRPFHSFAGVDFYPGTVSKTAPLFHSLVCNHCFFNGNKRTAVIAVDMFLLANGYVLAASNEQMYEVALDTAAHVERGESADQAIARLADLFNTHTTELSEVKKEPALRESYRVLVKTHRELRDGLLIEQRALQLAADLKATQIIKSSG